MAWANNEIAKAYRRKWAKIDRAKNPEKYSLAKKRYYERHKIEIKLKAKLRYPKVREKCFKQARSNRIYVNRLKCSPCMDCHNTYPPYVMDFDHRDSTTKKECISLMVQRRKLQEIEKEVKKCDLVCSNCHRIRTYKRQTHYARGAWPV